MRPAICDGDVITVEPAAPARVGAGNVIVYRQLDRVFAHRIVSVGADQGGHGAATAPRGRRDASATRPSRRRQVLGEVVAVRRRGGRPGSRSVLGMAGRVCCGRDRKSSAVE